MFSKRNNYQKDYEFCSNGSDWSFLSKYSLFFKAMSTRASVIRGDLPEYVGGFQAKSVRMATRVCIVQCLMESACCMHFPVDIHIHR